MFIKIMVIFFTKENTVRIKASRNFFPANFPNKKKTIISI